MPPVIGPGKLAAAVSALVVVAAVAAQAGTLSGCCLANGSCVDLDLGGCEVQGGVFQPGVSCNGASCGACCGVEGQSLECTLALATNCTLEQGRAFRGAGTQCGGNACTTCSTCSGGGDCPNQCQEDMSPLCPPGCVQSLALATCDSSCQSSGCCQLAFSGERVPVCVLSDPAACALAQG